MASFREYQSAAALLWGPAGEFAVDEFGRLNREHFAGSVPPLPIVIGLTAFGRCIGLTRYGLDWLKSPRISLAPGIFDSTLRVSDVLVHELAHAALMLRGEDPGHNGASWCRLITELSPDVLGREITAAPVGTRRVPNQARETDPKAPRTIVIRRAEPGALSRAELATWPQALRPGGYYEGGVRIAVPTY